MAAGPRIAIVDGCRTAFTKVGGPLAAMSPLDLSIAVVREVAERAEVPAGVIGSVVMGSALAYPSVPYLARETTIALGWHRTNAYGAESACATSARTIVNAAYELASGEAEIAIAGGAESLSGVPVESKPALREALRAASKARPEELLGVFLGLRLADLVPDPPRIAEPYTGKTLGEHAEELVTAFDVSRADSDAFAVSSHRKAAAATDDGRLAAEIVPVVTGDWETVKEDGLIRRDTTLEAAAKLSPVFDPEHGTVTAANASPLTDGAAAVLLATEDACERHDLEPLAWLRSWAFTSHDPGVGVLLGPAFALPLALDRAGIALADLDLVDLHEAFAGQVLAVLAALASEEFARTHLDRPDATGMLDADRLNVCGGSIALGHPFGATGARIVTQLARELARRGARYGALGICAGGTRGAAIVLERAA